MNLKQLLTSTPELQALLTATNPDYEGTARLINAVPMVPNTEPQQQVPVLPTLQEVMLLVTLQERYDVAVSPLYDKILYAVSNNRFDWVIDNLTTLLGGNVISQDSYDALMTALNNPALLTIPDPNYQPLIPDPAGSLAKQNNLDFVTAGQVALAWLN